MIALDYTQRRTPVCYTESITRIDTGQITGYIQDSDHIASSRAPAFQLPHRRLNPLHHIFRRETLEQLDCLNIILTFVSHLTRCGPIEGTTVRLTLSRSTTPSDTAPSRLSNVACLARIDAKRVLLSLWSYISHQRDARSMRERTARYSVRNREYASS